MIDIFNSETLNETEKFESVLKYFNSFQNENNLDKEQLFLDSFSENPNYTLRVLFWSSEQGFEKHFKDLIKIMDSLHTGKWFANFVRKIPKFSKFSNLFLLEKNINMSLFFTLEEMRIQNPYVFKELPRQGKSIKKLYTLLGFKNEASWRKFLIFKNKELECDKLEDRFVKVEYTNKEYTVAEMTQILNQEKYII